MVACQEKAHSQVKREVMMNDVDINIERNLSRISEYLLLHKQTLVTAESCTGGLLAAMITDHPGCSAWFKGSFVTYQTAAKTSMLGITEETFEQHPPVSETVARAMVERSLSITRADYAVALTGLAGPDPDESRVAVGTLWIGWGNRDGNCWAQQYELSEDRLVFRQKACGLALSALAEQLNLRKDNARH